MVAALEVFFRVYSIWLYSIWLLRKGFKMTRPHLTSATKNIAKDVVTNVKSFERKRSRWIRAHGDDMA